MMIGHDDSGMGRRHVPIMRLLGEDHRMTTSSDRGSDGEPPASHVSAIWERADRADARGWGARAPSEPRSHERGHSPLRPSAVVTPEESPFSTVSGLPTPRSGNRCSGTEPPPLGEELTNDGWGAGKSDLRPGRAGVRPQPHPSTRETTPGRERSRAVSRLDLSHNHGGRRSRPQPGAPSRGDARSRAGPGGRECDWIAGPLGQAPWNGPLPVADLMGGTTAATAGRTRRNRRHPRGATRRTSR
jgi:hypothetical protein